MDRPDSLQDAYNTLRAAHLHHEAATLAEMAYIAARTRYAAATLQTGHFTGTPAALWSAEMREWDKLARLFD